MLRSFRVRLFAMLFLTLLVGSQSVSADATKWSNSYARSVVYNNGMSVYSSGGCQDRYTSTCTSLEQIHAHTINSLITLKRASGCSTLTITGGTEVGHASGTYSHWNGYKVDIRHVSCVDSYIKNTFAWNGYRGDGAPTWKSAAGNIYADEGSHWDILYYS